MDILQKTDAFRAELSELASLAGKNSIKQLAKINAEIEAAELKKKELEEELADFTAKMNSIIENYSDLNITKEYIESKLSEGVSAVKETIKRIPKDEKIRGLINILKKKKVATFAQLATFYRETMSANLGSTDSLKTQGLLTDKCVGEVDGTNKRAGKPLFQNELLKHLETMQ